MAKKKVAPNPDPLPDPTISPMGIPVFFPYFPFVVSLVRESPWPEDSMVEHAECDPLILSVENWHIHNESNYGNVLYIHLVARIDLFAKSFKASSLSPFMDDVEISITLEDGTANEQTVLVPSICLVEVP